MLVLLKKSNKKFKFSRFPQKTLRVAQSSKYSNLLTILKKGLKKKKRKIRLAGKNFYVLAFKKLIAFQRQSAFFTQRYVFK